MMVNCPKCGFSQPQDQYCAKCGVDMVAYRPVAKPLMTRLLSNMSFQVSALALVALAGGLYVRQSNRERLARTIAETPVARDAEIQEQELAAAQADAAAAKPPFQQTVSASESTTAKDAAAAAEVQIAIAAAETTPNSEKTAVTASSAPAAAAAQPTAPVAERGANQLASTVRVYFIQAQRSLVTSLLRQARQGSTDGEANFGVVPGLQRKLEGSRAWQSLETASDQPIHINQPNVIFRGTLDQALGQNLGLKIEVTPLAVTATGTRVHVSVNRVLRDPANGIENLDFNLPESFTIPRDGSVLLTGILRVRRPLSDDEERLYKSVNVLKAMTTESFRLENTDVAIVIEAH